MSNHLAVAAVTASLTQTILNAVEASVPGADVTTLRPDAPGNGAVSPRVNVYLYQVTPNAAWRNADLPTRRSSGELAQRPQVALDLHYLLTFYGDEQRLEPQRLLGTVVSKLHARPILTRERIRDTITGDTFAFLAAADLAEAIELVKFTPTSLSLEELSKLWSVFFQTQYALSVAYEGTVVLIESDETPEPALPVRAPRLYVVPLKQPYIEEVSAAGGPAQPIVADSVLVLRGARLRGDITRVRIAGEEVEADSVTNAEVKVSLAAPALVAARLKAGIQGVQVVHHIPMGEPPVAHRGSASNVMPFVLRPSLGKQNGDYVISISGLAVNDADSTRSATITVDLVRPALDEKQRIALLLNDVARANRAYRFPASVSEVTSKVVVPVTGVEAGAYFLRLEVDGADSPLDTDADGKYVGPKVTLA